MIKHHIKSVLQHFPGLLERIKKLRKKLQGKIEIGLGGTDNSLNPKNQKSLPEIISEAKEVIAKIENFYSPEKELMLKEYEYKRELSFLIAALINNLSRNLKSYLYRPPLEWWMEGDAMKHLEGRAIPQGLIFMLDIYPTIRKLIEKFPSNYPLELLDAGGGSGAGAEFLAMLHRNTKVTVIDNYPYIQPYAEARFPEVEFIVSDITSLKSGRTWDIVVASHLIEHFEEPLAVIEELVKRAHYFVILYSPYKEYKRIPAHLFTFTNRFIKSLKPLKFKKIRSKGWRNSRSCFLAVLRGKAYAKTEN